MHVGEEFGLPPVRTGPAPIGDNMPPLVEPERLTAARSAVSTWCDAAGEWLEKGAIVDDEHAGAIKDLVAGATTLRKKIEATRRDTKKPFEEQAKAVDATFRPLTDALDKLVERIKPLETAYLQKKRAEAEAEQRRKREEAEEARKAAEAATAAAQARNDVMGEAEAEAALKAAEEAAAAAAAPVKVKIESASGGGGRATALRSIRRARITNLSMAFGIVRGDPAVVEAIEAALNRLVRSKDFNPSTDLPGVEVYLEEKAA